MQSQRFIFRAAKDAEELYQLLKLRYEIYRDSRLAGFVRKNQYGVDIDAYDFHAVHFGLFEQQGYAEVPVGYMRVIGNTKLVDCPLKILPEDIGSNLLFDARHENSFMYPCMMHFPEAKESIKAVGARGRFCEGSRFAISKKYKDIRLSKFMFEASLAYTFLYEKMDGALIGCTAEHARFYQRYGFKPMPNSHIGDGIEGVIDAPVVLLLLTAPQLPARYQEGLKRMALSYSALGHITSTSKLSLTIQLPEAINYEPATTKN